MDFLTIDFETANRYEYSPCSVAIFHFTENSCSKLYSTLINPGDDVDFDPFFTNIHGITKDMVKDSPKANEALLKICDIINNNFIFAHNVHFDVSQIINGCREYNISLPNFEYADSLMISKRTWQGLPNYQLDTVADNLNLFFIHHNAEDDAKICGEIIKAAILQHNVNSLDELLDDVRYVKGICFNNELKKAYSKDWNIKPSKSDYEKALELNVNIDADTPISGKYVVFTGTLNIVRSEAMKICADNGAIPQGGINKKTNYLVVGRDDYGNFKDGNKSNKMIKAEELISKGQDLEIVTEEDFFKMI